MENMDMKFVHDDIEVTSGNLEEFSNLIKERESTQKWVTDFPSELLNLKDIPPLPMFTHDIAEKNCFTRNMSDEEKALVLEAVSSSMYRGDGDEGYLNGTSQMVQVEGRYYPIGESAVEGLLERAGLAAKGWKNEKDFNLEDLSTVLNMLLKAAKEKVCVLVEDQKVRAVNSGRYAICPTSYVLSQTLNWIKTEKPDAEFVGGYYSHNFARWIISLEKYANEIFANFPDLIDRNFAPALVVTTGNTGNNSVSLKIGVSPYKGMFIPIEGGIFCNHISTGSADERQTSIEESVKKSFSEIYPKFSASVADLGKMKNIVLSNPVNALKRVMAKVGMPKRQGMEAVEIFAQLFPGSATAFDCYLAMVDCLEFINRDNAGKYIKQFEAANAVFRAANCDWKEYDIPGDFSW